MRTLAKNLKVFVDKDQFTINPSFKLTETIVNNINRDDIEVRTYVERNKELRITAIILY